MNLIVERVPRIRWYTDLHPFLAALGDHVNEFVWRFDDVDTNVAMPTEEKPGGVWCLTGDQFRSLVFDHPQFVWAVISAIPRQHAGDAFRSKTVPYADGNRGFWTGSPKPQHPDAEFEVVCWDSSATLLIGAEEKIGTAFRNAYPETIDLDRKNADRDRIKR